MDKKFQNNIFIMYVNALNKTVTLQYPNSNRKDVFTIDTFWKQIDEFLDIEFRAKFNTSLEAVGNHFLVDLDTKMLRPLSPSANQYELMSQINKEREKMSHKSNPKLGVTRFFNPLEQRFNLTPKLKKNRFKDFFKN